LFWFPLIRTSLTRKKGSLEAEEATRREQKREKRALAMTYIPSTYIFSNFGAVGGGRRRAFPHLRGKKKNGFLHTSTLLAERRGGDLKGTISSPPRKEGEGGKRVVF